MAVRPGAEAFSCDGGDVGVLLCHGFTGNPSSLLPWARHLEAAGHTVRLPRLPGHGTTWQEMATTRWPQWYAEVDAAFGELRAGCRTVAVGGLSMGGGLALRLAEQHGSAPGSGVDGLVLVNPAVMMTDRRLAAVPVARWAVRSFPPVGSDIRKPGVQEDAYARVPAHALHSVLRFFRLIAADLPRVDQPVLLFRSAQDHVVPAASSALVLRRITSTDVTERVLTDSFHVATLDHDAPTIFEESLAFVERLSTTVGGAR